MNLAGVITIPDDGRFEKISHKTFGGEHLTLPILIKDYEVLDDQSRGLLMVANIIGTEGVDITESVHDLIASTARIQQGISSPTIVADDLGGGAFTISAEETKVRSRFGGKHADYAVFEKGRPIFSAILFKNKFDSMV